MICAPYKTDQSQSVIALFTKVFTDAEGSEEGQSISRLVNDLIHDTDSNDLFGYVSVVDGVVDDAIVGAIFFSRLILASGKSAFILSPVAVDSQHQGQGIGQQLIRFGIEQLKSDGVELLFTYGDPNYYSKVGFNPISEEQIRAPHHLTQPEGWLAQALQIDKTGEGISKETEPARCVSALDNPVYW